MRSWSQALALAPMVLGVVACSGAEVANDAGIEPDAGTPARDAGEAPRDAGTIADAGFMDAAVRDAGFADSGVEPDSGVPPDSAVEPDSGVEPDAGNPGCTYPSGAVEPMALDQVITPYTWPAAINGAGQRFDIDLTQAHCANDPDIDWSPHDVLVFISIPAW